MPCETWHVFPRKYLEPSFPEKHYAHNVFSVNRAMCHKRVERGRSPVLMRSELAEATTKRLKHWHGSNWRFPRPMKMREWTDWDSTMLTSNESARIDGDYCHIPARFVSILILKVVRVTLMSTPLKHERIGGRERLFQGSKLTFRRLGRELLLDGTCYCAKVVEKR